MLVGIAAGTVGTQLALAVSGAAAKTSSPVIAAGMATSSIGILLIRISCRGTKQNEAKDQKEEVMR